MSGRRHCDKAGVDPTPVGGCSGQEDFFKKSYSDENLIGEFRE